MLDTIPGPLRDRMEIISLAGYTEDEKLEIARRYLVRRQLEANGLKPGQVEIADEALARHHPSATRARPACAASSARSARCCATPRCASPKGRAAPIRIGRERPRRHPRRAALRERGGDAHQRARRGDRASPGRRSAATSCSSRRRAFPGNGRLILTGQLGDVMRESAQAALQPRQEPRGRARHRRRPLREERHPHPRAGRRDPEGRAERRRRDVHGAGLAADRPDGAQRHRDDRRDQPARPGAAGRRHQGEGRRRARAPASRASCCRRATARTTRTFRRSARKQLEFVWLERVDEAVAAALEPAKPAENAPSSVPQLAGAEA